MARSRLVLPGLLAPLVAAAGTLVPIVAAPPAAAAAARTVTVVGSLQDELGCAADWQPDCTATDLARGRRQHDVRREFTVPAGSYELKVAINHSGTRATARAAPRRRNIPLALQAPATAALHLRRHDARDRHRPDRPAGRRHGGRHEARRHQRCASSLTRERFYFVMADRFANGDTANDKRRPDRRPARDRLRPDGQGLLPRRRPQGPDEQARLHQGPRHDRDLADAVVQEPAGPGHRRRRQRRLPRLLDHRLHPDRPAPRHQRRHEDADRRGPRARG